MEPAVTAASAPVVTYLSGTLFTASTANTATLTVTVERSASDHFTATWNNIATPITPTYDG
jgi:hypothetical protein